MTARQFHPGMGQAVAERTILRRDENGKFETWADVAHRVALGNTLLCAEDEDREAEYDKMHDHLAKVTLLMSGRHLQHGDENQPNRTMEVFTNCSSSSSSFMLFYLLMSGSGVGRCYDDDLMLVNFDDAPNVLCVLDEFHPDFDYNHHHSLRDAKHRYGKSDNVIWFDVPDSREGWAKAVEMWETLAYEKVHKDKLLILNFSPVRCKGTPIHGMQDRPASGPGPLMYAFEKAVSIKGAKVDPWFQAMFVDHCFAECVLVGGARRAARMSVKFWRDRNIIDFINVKRPIEYQGKTMEEVVEIRKTQKPLSFLWSSNNSILVDEEFWTLLGLNPGDEGFDSEDAIHARAVFKAASEAAYFDGTGEPGFINVDKLVQNREGFEEILKGEYVGSPKYQVEQPTTVYLQHMAKATSDKTYYTIVNPCSEIAFILLGAFCVHGDTRILHRGGYDRIEDLVGKDVEVFNGEEWSKVTPFQTGIAQKLLRVKFSDGSYLDCTPYHKFSVKRSRQAKNFFKVQAKDLWAGAILPTFRVPEDIGGHFLEDAYTYGAFLGDGSIEWRKDNNSYRYDIDLYDGKHHLPVSGSRGSLYEAAGSITVTVSHLDRELLHELKGGDLPSRLFNLDRESTLEFIKGWLDTDGLFCRDSGGVAIDTSDKAKAYGLQLLLRRIGISYASVNQTAEIGDLTNFGPRKKPMFRVYIPASEASLLNAHRVKTDYELILDRVVKQPRVESIEELPGVHATYCFEEPKKHMGVFNNVLTHQCVIADLVPFFGDTLDEIEDAFRTATRSLIRVNTMPSVYRKEVERTNRIGVAITGIHEFAWKFFGYNFHDLIDEEKSKDFWLTMSRFARAVEEEAREYCKVHNLPFPHTLRTIKPSGTVSKLWGLTEGWHLPSMAWYLRWVQFSENDPLVETYAKAGYPTRKLKSYKNTIIVGFPTKLAICDLMPDDKIVFAGEATPEQQYQWLKLGEKYWIECLNDDETPRPDRGNQISYTLKYDPTKVSYEDFAKTLREQQSKVRCCSVMPQEDTSAYEYLPEEPISKDYYDLITAHIELQKQLSEVNEEDLVEDIGKEHIDCANGACPVDFKKAK